MSTATTVKSRPILFSGPMIRALLAGQKTQTRRVAKNFPDWVDHVSPWCSGGVQIWNAEDDGMNFRECPHGKPGERLWVRESLWISDCGGYFARDLYRPHEVMCEVLSRDGSRRWRVRGERERIGEGDYTDTVVGWGNHGCDRGRGEDRRWVPAFDQSFIGGLEPPTPEHPYGKTIDRREAMFRKHWPAIHMPRWASRLTLEITEVRVERLNDISESDCWSEGIEEIDGMFRNAEIIDMANRIGCCIDDAKPTYACLWESINGPGSWTANPFVWVVSFRRLESSP